MEGVDDVDVVEVGGGGLVGEVDGVLEGEVPDGEGLELGVAGLHAPLVLVVHLRQAGGELAGAGARRGDDHQVTAGLDVVVDAEALLGDDAARVGRVAGDDAVAVHLEAQALEALHEGVGDGVVVGELGEHDVLHEEAPLPEDVDEAEGVLLVRDAEVGADLLAFEVLGVEADDDLDVLLDPLEHGDLVVRREAGQDAGGVHVVEELAAHLEVELAADLRAAGVDVLRLQLDVTFAIESDPVRHACSPGFVDLTALTLPAPGCAASSTLLTWPDGAHLR